MIREGKDTLIREQIFCRWVGDWNLIVDVWLEPILRVVKLNALD